VREVIDAATKLIDWCCGTYLTGKAAFVQHDDTSVFGMSDGGQPQQCDRPSSAPRRLIDLLIEHEFRCRLIVGGTPRSKCAIG